jgi:sphingolipid 4-desaturase/C4-monooxygenase
VAPVFLAAFFFGQLIMHSTGALLHETAHRLVFRRRATKLCFDLSLELIFGSFGKQLRYQQEHIQSHHPYLGEYDLDYEHEDICGYMARRELRAHHPGYQRAITIATMTLHILPFGFILSDKIIPPIYAHLTGRKIKDENRNIPATKAPRLDIALSICVSLFVNIVLFFGFGFWAWLYHNWSLSLFLSKLGITNLGQSLSEHPEGSGSKPTRSSYGWLNWLLFNTGYHHEHHTFPNVAWVHLPKLKASAPLVFNCASEKSYVTLWWNHVKADFSPSRWNTNMQAVDLAICKKKTVAFKPQAR